MLSVSFAIALLLCVAVKLWLGARQAQHVLAHRCEVPARFRDAITLEAHQKAADYTVARVRLNAVYTVIEAVLLVGLTLLGGIQYLDDSIARGLAHSNVGALPRQVLLIVLVLLVSALVDLPFSLYRRFSLEERFGFNRMTLGLFMRDLLVSSLLALVFGAPLLFGVLYLMQAAGRLWWLDTWLLFTSYSLFVTWLYPVLIAPLFNRFTPLEDGTLVERVRALSTRCGFVAKGVFVMDGSRRSSHGNAYFTGFGANKRIVFFDTLVARLSASEIEAVLAHELGHFKLHHVVKRLAWSFCASLLALALLGYLIETDWFYLGLGVDPTLATRNAVGLMLFLLVLPVFTFLLSPLFSLGSRRHEFEADAYAAHQTDRNELVQALVKLYQDNAATLTPDPLHSAFFDSHPPATIRIARLEAAPT